MNKLTILIDGFGGDHSPLCVLQGASRAVAELDVAVTVTGDEDKLRICAEQNGISLDGITIVHTDSVITNDDEPTEILKGLSDSSMALGLKLLAEGKGDAFVSAGSTGALVVGSSLIVKRIKGIKRAPLGTMLPSATGCTLLLDVGANAECRPEFLTQFAHMGSFYMQTVMDVNAPRVGLLNIGTEDKKGLELQVETNRLLKTSKLNYFGNIEGRDVPMGTVDVAVSDGFTGNVLLKTMEGMGAFFNGFLKEMFLSNVKTKLAALMVKKDLKELKSKFDYSEYGGAPLLGISKPVIKAHGSSNGTAIFNAIRQAKKMVDSDMVGIIAAYAKDASANREAAKAAEE